jgi:hypothetical protein
MTRLALPAPEPAHSPAAASDTVGHAASRLLGVPKVRCRRRSLPGLGLARLATAHALALGLSLALLCAAPAAPALAAPRGEGEAARDLLRQAIDLYLVGHYREAAERLRPLVETRVLQDRADQAEALRAYGISLFLVGARAGAERAFRDLLRVEPMARMDPAFVRPEVVQFFEEVRRRHLAERHEIRRRASSSAPNLLPPWGQFRNGHRTKAYAILGGEVALLATTITTFALLKSWEGPTQEFLGHESSFGPLRAVNLTSAVALAGLVIYGIVDGYVCYYRQQRAGTLPDQRAMGPASRTFYAGPGLPIWTY